MQKIAYILVGDNNAGKSTSIRCLTGTYQTNYGCTIRTRNNTDILLFVKPQSMQEAQMNIAEMMTALNGYSYCLIGLRLLGWNHAPDSADVYIDALINAGWDVQLVYLDNTPPHFFNRFQNLPSLHLPRLGRPLNVISSLIRVFFDWL